MMNKEDFKIETKRGHGPGGQHRNKIESCVVVTHIATGITETCQDSRSQARNIDIAKEKVIKRIKDISLKEKHLKQNTLRRHLIHNPETIRTYHYIRNEVKDHRSGNKYNLKKFMNGEVDLKATRDE